MLNYEVSPELLLPRVPAGTELDLWRERALVSVVGFRFLDNTLLGVLAADSAGLWGAEFTEALSAPPRSAFIADGSPVTVCAPRRLPPR